MRNGIQAIKLSDKLAQFDEHWSPRIIGELNSQQVKIVKMKGDFIWHKHEEEDELFLVLHGRLTIELEGSEVVLHPGELAIIPKGTLHRPRCDGEAHVLLLEPASTVNTGDVNSDRARKALWI